MCPTSTHNVNQPTSTQTNNPTTTTTGPTSTTGSQSSAASIAAASPTPTAASIAAASPTPIAAASPTPTAASIAAASPTPTAASIAAPTPTAAAITIASPTPTLPTNPPTNTTITADSGSLMLVIVIVFPCVFILLAVVFANIAITAVVLSKRNSKAKKPALEEIELQENYAYTNRMTVLAYNETVLSGRTEALANPATMPASQSENMYTSLQYDSVLENINIDSQYKNVQATENIDGQDVAYVNVQKPLDNENIEESYEDMLELEDNENTDSQLVYDYIID